MKIYEDAGDFYKAADEYHQLGMLAQEQRQFNQAISYYPKALGVYEKFQDWYRTSLTLAKLGKVLEAQSNFSQALAIYIHGLAIGIKHYQEFIEVFIYLLAGMLQTLGENEFDAIWRELTGSECVGEWRKAIWAARDRLDEDI